MKIREKGKVQFEKGNYQKAITFYQQFIDQENDDLKSVYNNIALCHFKLKNYKEVIKACENALQDDKYFVKAYYRLYVTYKMMPGEDYKVFINALMFLKYFNDPKTSSTEEAMQIVKQYKKRFKQNYPIQNKQQDVHILSLLQQNQLESPQQQLNSELKLIKNSPQDLKLYLLKPQISFQSKLTAIREVILHQNYHFGLNILYMCENSCKDMQDKNKIKDFTKAVKREFIQLQQKDKKQKQKEKQIEKEKQVVQLKNEKEGIEDDSQQSNIRNSSAEQHQQTTKTQNLQHMSNIISTQTKAKQQPQQIKPQEDTISKEQIVIQQQMKQNHQENHLLPQQKSILKEQKQLKKVVETSKKQEISSHTYDFEQEYNKYIDKILVSKDVFMDIKSTIIQIAIFKCSDEKKQDFLERLIKKFKKQIGFFKMSLSKPEKHEIYNKLTQNNLSKYTSTFNVEKK